MTLSLVEVESPIGAVLVAASDDGLCCVEFAEHRARVLAQLRRRFGPEPVREDADPFGARRALAAYFAGRHAAIDALAVDAGGTEFQRAVWAALRRIPCGTTLTYRELAARAGRPTAIRAAGHANGQNPLSIVVPCHRVIGTDGTLTGYGGGLERKRWLLAHEGALPEARASG
jgi:methylated-DNA-[protein]-cysteine S-methyltransferase